MYQALSVALRSPTSWGRHKGSSEVSTHGCAVALMPTPVGSVLIPAHNEAAVIVRCLDALFDGVEPGRLEVVVACNGCTDDTARLARSAGHAVSVVELPQASKAGALRAGEQMLTVFPRLYLDADIVLRGPSALAAGGAVAHRSRSGGPAPHRLRHRGRIRRGAQVLHGPRAPAGGDGVSVGGGGLRVVGGGPLPFRALPRRGRRRPVSSTGTSPRPRSRSSPAKQPS